VTDYLARRLLAAGVRAGDRVGLHLPNIPELALSYLGCIKAGIIAVPINARLKAREIDYILHHSEAVGYIGHRDYYPEVEGLRKKLPELRLFCVAGEIANESSVVNLKDLWQPLGEPAFFPIVDGPKASVILYTSGTTARPKGVTHSHKSLIQIAKTMRRLELNENQIALVTSAVTHPILLDFQDSGRQKFPAPAVRSAKGLRCDGHSKCGQRKSVGR
jgi:acyl-coenzyme A synthetase/AMP-(fatty) acid ligase